MSPGLGGMGAQCTRCSAGSRLDRPPAAPRAPRVDDRRAEAVYECQLVECGARPGPPAPPHVIVQGEQHVTVLDLETYRRRAEEFMRRARQGVLRALLRAARPVCDTAAVYDRFPELFTREAIDELNRIYEVDHRRRQAPARLPARVHRRRLHGRGDKASRRRDRQHREPDDHRGRRRGASACARPASSRPTRPTASGARASRRPVSPPPPSSSTRCSTRLWRRCHDLAVELGYPNYMELYSEVKGLDYDLHARRAARPSCTTRPGSTSAPWTDLGAGAPRHPARGAALLGPRPTSGARPDYDGVFAADALVPTLRRHAGRPGHRPRRPAQRAPRHGGPRAQVAARLLLARARARTRSISSCCRRAGRTTTWRCCTRPGTPSTSRTSLPTCPSSTGILGDNAVTEGFAFIFDHLLLNAAGCDTYLDYHATTDDFLRFANVSDLYYMRRYAAKLAYEVELHSQTGPLDGMAAVYSARLSEAHHGATSRRRATCCDVDDGFYCGELPARLDARGRPGA